MFKQHQQSFKTTTPGRGMINVSAMVAEIVSAAKVSQGLCNIFLHHTSASVIICENADIVVQQDMEAFMSDLIPDGHALFKHIDEGPCEKYSDAKFFVSAGSQKQT
jgi:secondary thiamine-phosphate synthase enzyme